MAGVWGQVRQTYEVNARTEKKGIRTASSRSDGISMRRSRRFTFLL